MDALDGIILVLVVLALWHGYRVGAVAQLISIAGFLVGLVLGVALIIAIEPHLHGTTAKLLVALGLLILPASLLGGAARQLGDHLWRRLVHVPLARPVDAALGSAVAVAGTLVVCWLFASILVNSEIPSIPAAIDRSQILRGVDDVLPPVPNSFASVERYLTTSGFPQVLVNMVPEPVTAVSVPASPYVRAAISASGASVMKIIALGCGDELEGTGFAVSGDLVATNAHVIAGTNEITVQTSTGTLLHATPVYFDPRLDFALLRLGVDDLRPLTLDTNYVERGAPAAVLGFPHGGPFLAEGAGVLSRIYAQGRDIYDSAITERIVYEVKADVQPGNSGGPLVTKSGEVIGVVFSRSTSQSDVGFALASPPVATAVAGAMGDGLAEVSTQSCAA